MAIELAPRDKRRLGFIAVIATVLVLVALPVGSEILVSNAQDENDNLRLALGKVQDARPKVREWHEKKDAVVQRYAKKAPQLPTFLDEAARKQNLKPGDVSARPDTPIGKAGVYVERRTDLSLSKAGLLGIAKLLEAIEKSGFPLTISQLALHSRAGEPDKYDVNIGVSAFDRVEKAAPPVDKDKDTSKDKDASKDKKL